MDSQQCAEKNQVNSCFTWQKHTVLFAQETKQAQSQSGKQYSSEHYGCGGKSNGFSEYSRHSEEGYSEMNFQHIKIAISQIHL